MKVYDTANKLAYEIEESQEYKDYKNAKDAVEKNKELKEKMEQFEQERYVMQKELLETGKIDEEKNKKVVKAYAEIMEHPEGKTFIEAEMKFNMLIADINKIIGKVIQNVMK